MSRPDKAHLQVVLLGTGTPNAEPDRSGPSVAVVVGGQPYIVDMGPGLVRRAMAAFRDGVAALEAKRLTRAFLTHLHSDHTAGYPDLMLTPWVLERAEPLHVYGPPGLQEMTAHLLAAFQQDIAERLAGLEPANDRGCVVLPHEVEAGIVYRDDRVSVEAFPVQHGSWPAFGFRFMAAGRVVVISGDTAPTDVLVDKAQGCALLIHEVYSAHGFETRPPDWQRYHAHVHTSAHELGDMAARIRPGLLVLYHQLCWGVSEEELVAEVQSRYDGPVVYGHDLDRFS